MAEPFLDAAYLRANTFIRHVEIYDELGSTNDHAATLAGDSRLALPALIAARRQTAGRGRGQNSWWSADGALTFSILLEPATLGIRTTDWPRLSLTTAVAIIDAMTKELNPQSPPPFAIKWPNDVFLNDAKIAGILIESPGGPPPAKNRLIIGVGINVNNSWRNPPPELDANGAALCDFTGYHHDLQHILTNMLQSLHSRMDQLVDEVPQLPATWQQLSWLTGRNVKIEGASTISGACLGIDTDGALLVQDTHHIHRIFSGTARAT